MLLTGLPTRGMRNAVRQVAGAILSTNHSLAIAWSDGNQTISDSDMASQETK